MASETEMERLIVRLVGDGSSFQKMFAQAVTSAQTATAAIESASKRIETVTSSIKGFAAVAMTTLASFGAKSFLEGTLKGYADAETTQLRLKAAIDANGGAVDSVIAKHKQFASAMQDATSTAKGETYALLTRAEIMGLSGNKAEQATQMSIGLAASLGGEAEHYIMVAKAIQEGNAEMIHHIPALRGIKDENEKLAKAQELAVKGFKVAQTMAGSTAGTMKKLDVTMGALKKQFGEVVADALIPVIKWVTKVLELFTHLDTQTKQIIVSAAALTAAGLAIGPAWGSLKVVLAPLTYLGGLVLSLAGYLSITLPLQIASTAAWLVWKAAVLLASVAVAALGVAVSLFNVLFTAFSFLMDVGSVSTVAWTVATAIAEAATWLWNAATIAATAAVNLWTASVAAGVVAYTLFNFGLSVGTILSVAWSAAVAAMDVVTTIWAAGILAAQGVMWLWDAAVAAATLENLAWVGSVLVSTASAAFWGTVSAIATSATWLWNLALAAADLLMAGFAAGTSGASLASIAFAAGALIAKVAVWLLNAALTVTDILLAGIPIVIGVVVAVLAALVLALAAAAAAFLGVGLTATAAALAIAGVGSALIFVGAVASAGIGVVAVALMSAWESAKGLYDILANLPGTFGPLNAIADLFLEWFNILKDVVRVAKVDLPLAWEILQAAAKLAVAQVMNLWEPLWTYVKGGFSALWNVAVLYAEIKWGELVDAVKVKLLQVPSEIGDAFDAAIDYMKVKAKEFAGYATQEDVQAAKDKVTEVTVGTNKKGKDDLQAAFDAAQARLKAAMANFALGPDSPEVVAARAEVDRLRKLIPEAEAKARRDVKGGKGLDFSPQIGKTTAAAKDATAAITKLDAVLIGSAQAKSDIAAYLIAVSGEGKESKGKKGQKPIEKRNFDAVQARQGLAGAGANQDPLIQIMMQIRASSEQTAKNTEKPAVALQAANVGG